jgi:hypothetical protein
MATYRYFFADLITNAINAELQITGVNFTQALNSAGTLNGSILLSGVPASMNVTFSTIPGKTAVYVDRDGVIVWGGILWFRSYNSKDQRLTISAREFESYFERRRIATNQTYFNTDQLSVARGLVTSAQAVANGNIGVLTGSETSGVNVTRLFYGYEQKTVYQALLDLSRSNTGFDFAIRCAYDSDNNITKTLALGYPRLGTAYSATSTTAPVFEFPAGNVIEYEYPEDGSLVANKIYATGAGSNEGKLIYNASDATKLSSGWPLLEDSVSFSDIIDATLIQGLASGRVAAVSYPPTTIKLVANPSISPVLGSYVIGDDARVRIRDDRFPDGIDTIYRIAALSVTPGETGPERVTVTLTLPTS